MINKNTSGNVLRAQRGFTLIEVLIALIIMSVGMLGIASLYVQSMQAGRTSLFRHNAVTLAGDVTDRIRANPTAGAAYAIPGGFDYSCVDGGVSCSNTQIAAQDILQWEQQATDSLPTGGVAVAFNNATVPPEYTVTISWVEPGVTPSYVVKIPVR